MNKLESAAIKISEISGKDNVLINEPMSRHTSFKVGGPADILVKPCSREQVTDILDYCRKECISVFVMGNGSNLIVRDKGIRGVVVKITENISGLKVKGDTIRAEAGILLSKLSKAALDAELTGLEFASGIPGTLGGAVVMNAGAYDGEMKNVVARTEYIDQNGEIRVLEGDEHQFGYRTSLIQRSGGIVLCSELRLVKGDKAAIKAKMDDLNRRRKEKQPLEMPSAGSVFRRPAGHFAGKLVEDCGLRGYRIGGAQVSEMHCGFIVNAGNASSEDILNLIKHIQSNVLEDRGVELLTEVKIIGEV